MSKTANNTSLGCPPSAVIYARVSSAEQQKEGYSIPAQLQLLEDYAQKHQLQIAHTFVDVETAKKAGRTQFREMVKLLHSQPQIRVILVEKTDRLYRNFSDYVTLEGRDVEIHLVKEGEILSKESRSHVKFIHGIKVLMAKNFIDNLAEEVKKGHLEKAKQGEYPAKAPLGYRNNIQSKTVQIHPEKSRYVRRMFELAAEGRLSLPGIRKQIMEEGLKLYTPSVRLSKSHVKRILENPFYYGQFRWNGQMYRGNYEPLISQESFDRVQESLGNKRKPKYRKHTFAFSGLLTCGRCGCTVTAEIHKKRYIYYHCTKSRKTCDETLYREEDLVQQFDEIVQGITIDPAIQDWLVLALKEGRKEKATLNQDMTDRLQHEVKTLKNRLEKVYLDKLDGKVSEDFWCEKSQIWQAEHDRLVAQLKNHQTINRTFEPESGLKLIELAAQAYELYSKQPPEEKNKFLKILLSNCTLERATLCPTYKKPFDLFAKGVKTGKWGE